MPVPQELNKFPQIRAKLVEACKNEAKRELLIKMVLRHRNYPIWLESKLQALVNARNLDSVLNEIRNNPVEFDAYASILKIAWYFVTNGHSSTEFLPSRNGAPSPDIKISAGERDAFVEVKRLEDTSHWDEIQDALRSVPSRLVVDIKVDFSLLSKQAELIVEAAKEALVQRKQGEVPPRIDDYGATITFLTEPGTSQSSTTVVISTKEVFKLVGDEEYTGEPGQMRYSDLRRLFASRLDEALSQLSSKIGCHIVIFDTPRFELGFNGTLKDAFMGTPKVSFKAIRGAEFFRAKDGLFSDSRYSPIDLVANFFGDSPQEILSNPKSRQGANCRKLLFH